MFRYESKVGGLPAVSWTPLSELDSPTIEQIKNLQNHPRGFHHVAIMPDAHAGIGMPIGGVVALDGAISPNMVGSDIGCGMGAVQTSLPVKGLTRSQIVEIFERVAELVPAGVGRYHEKPHQWGEFSRYEQMVKHTEPGWMTDKNWARATASLGTLGSGNHFMELQHDGESVFLMIHTGSRGLGAVIHQHYAKLAADGNAGLAPKGLEFFDVDSHYGHCYLRDMNFALAYAEENRRIIMELFEWAFFASLPLRVSKGVRVLSRVNIHHNYAALEHHHGKQVWVHRKGATSAKPHELGIIPGSMGTPSYIVRGRGSVLSFGSCSHGAGRLLSRSKAKEQLTEEQVKRVMRDVYVHGSIPIDEAPQAYKDIEDVINKQQDLVEVVAKLYPLGVYKG